MGEAPTTLGDELADVYESALRSGAGEARAVAA
jgi:hypothetical protein